MTANYFHHAIQCVSCPKRLLDFLGLLCKNSSGMGHFSYDSADEFAKDTEHEVKG